MPDPFNFIENFDLNLKFIESLVGTPNESLQIIKAAQLIEPANQIKPYVCELWVHNVRLIMCTSCICTAKLFMWEFCSARSNFDHQVNEFVEHSQT